MPSSGPFAPVLSMRCYWYGDDLQSKAKLEWICPVGTRSDQTVLSSEHAESGYEYCLVTIYEGRRHSAVQYVNATLDGVQ